MMMESIRLLKLFFAKCSVVTSLQEVAMTTSKTQAEWLAAVSWFEKHPCRVWFGSPTQGMVFYN